MKAKELLKNGETAAIVFTKGLNLNINKGGKSTSGVWRVSKNLSSDKVIVYVRNEEKNSNDIYIGDFSNLIPSTVEGLEDRFVLEFNNTKFAGTTDENWNGFTEKKQGAASPVRYIR